MNNQISNSYDSFAPYYRQYAQKKLAYLKTIDNIIVQNVPLNAKRLLDVGAGDGERGMVLARKIGVNEIILSDSSLAMVQKCKQLNPADVWHTSAEDLPQINDKFDIILCLWNVLGHIENRNSRLQALGKIKNLLSNNSLLFLDVNNRHNASSYGWIKVIFRILIDFILPDDRRGDVNIAWQLEDRVLTSKGHLFTPREVENIILQSGLKIIKRIPVNYKTGEIKKSSLQGQLLYILKK